jgi:DNA-binding FadR family transcriptional regulator
LEARRTVEPAVAQFALEMIDEESATKIFNPIVETTRNTSLTNYVRPFLDLFTSSDFEIELRRRYLTEEKYVWESIKIHREIYESLKSRDKKKLQSSGKAITWLVRVTVL